MHRRERSEYDPGRDIEPAVSGLDPEPRDRCAHQETHGRHDVRCQAEGCVSSTNKRFHHMPQPHDKERKAGGESSCIVCIGEQFCDGICRQRDRKRPSYTSNNGLPSPTVQARRKDVEHGQKTKQNCPLIRGGERLHEQARDRGRGRQNLTQEHVWAHKPFR